jgi:hypothetical protein
VDMETFYFSFGAIKDTELKLFYIKFGHGTNYFYVKFEILTDKSFENVQTE